MLSTDLLTRQAVGRTDLLRDAILDTAPAICPDRARLLTESYRESEGEPIILRKARAFARILEGMSIYIHPGELVVGNQASRPRAAPIFPEYSVDWLLQEMDDFPTRPLDQFQVSEEAKAELQEAMATNFQGQHGEEVRQLLLNKAPKFGNDDDYVDLLTKKVADCFAEAIHGLATVRGAMGPPPSLSLPTSLRVGLPGRPPTAGGPEGRRAGEPLSDNNSPAAGSDVHGPTAAAKSVAKLDHSRQTNGTIFNLTLHPTALEGVDQHRKFSALIRTFFQLKGSQVQFNIVSAEMLKDAQLHPEKYKNLVVKVAGYSALFSSLDKRLQDQIIQRTSHQLH